MSSRTGCVTNFRPPQVGAQIGVDTMDGPGERPEREHT